MCTLLSMRSTDLANELTINAVRPRRAASATLVGAGVAFALYALLRPYADEASPDGVAAVASAAWVGSHLLAVAALILLPIALNAAGLGRAGLVTAVGSGLVLPYYGAETFGLQAVAAAVPGSGGMPPLADAIRFGVAQSVTFGVGLLLLAAGGVLVAVAVRRRGGGWSGLPFALGMVLFLPQFFGPPPVRIAHGLLVLAGCALLAGWTARRTA